MPTFRFQFESVLRHRQMIEDQAQRKLADLLARRGEMVDELSQMQGDISTSKRQLASGLVGKVDVQQIGRFANYSGQVTLRAQTLVRQVAAFDRQVEEARGELLKATQNRRALELLREKHHRKWQQQQERRETAELDEVAMQRAAEHAMKEVHG